jgi:hypothetical protein
MDDFNKAINTLDLWLKVKDGTSLSLMDVPELIPLRWQYIKENWKTIKAELISRISSYTNPQGDSEGIKNSMIYQLEEFDNLVNLRPKKEGTRI